MATPQPVNLNPVQARVALRIVDARCRHQHVIHVIGGRKIDLPNNWNDLAEFIATVPDPKGQGGLVELGATSTVLASISPAALHDLSGLTPGVPARLKFRFGCKAPGIIGCS